jgi:hypothetical protein
LDLRSTDASYFLRSESHTIMIQLNCTYLQSAQVSSSDHKTSWRAAVVLLQAKTEIFNGNRWCVTPDAERVVHPRGRSLLVGLTKRLHQFCHSEAVLLVVVAACASRIVRCGGGGGGSGGGSYLRFCYFCHVSVLCVLVFNYARM